MPEYEHRIEQRDPGVGGAQCTSGDVVKCTAEIQVDGSPDERQTNMDTIPIYADQDADWIHEESR